MRLFLFFTQLQTESKHFRTASSTMYARNSWPFFNRTFGETLLPFQEKLSLLRGGTVYRLGPHI